MLQQQLMPHICIVSGPAAKRDRVLGAFAAEQLVTSVPEGHGLPSYSDPLTAAAAGAPNSGHTPGTSHPETLDFYIAPGDHKKDPERPCTEEECEHVGKTEMRPNPLEEHHGSEYEEDPGIQFLAVQCDDQDRIIKILADSGWNLRLFVPPVLQTLEEAISDAERLDRIEADLAHLRGDRR